MDELPQYLSCKLGCTAAGLQDGNLVLAWPLSCALENSHPITGQTQKQLSTVSLQQIKECIASPVKELCKLLSSS